MNGPQRTFECQIRIKRVSNVQKKVSHDQNRLEPFRTGSAQMHFWMSNSDKACFKRAKKGVTWPEPFGTV